MLEENVKLLEMYGKISILLGEVALTTCENMTYWLVRDDEGDYMIQLVMNDDNNLVLYILEYSERIECNCYVIHLESHSKIYTIMSYAAELGINIIQMEI